MPKQTATNGIGKQKPTENPGVGSPFQTGGGGGGAACTQRSVAASYTVPGPHSAALAVPGTAPAANTRPNAREAAALRQSMDRVIGDTLRAVPTRLNVHHRRYSPWLVSDGARLLVFIDPGRCVIR